MKNVSLILSHYTVFSLVQKGVFSVLFFALILISIQSTAQNICVVDKGEETDKLIELLNLKDQSVHYEENCIDQLTWLKDRRKLLAGYQGELRKGLVDSLFTDYDTDFILEVTKVNSFGGSGKIVKVEIFHHEDDLNEPHRFSINLENSSFRQYTLDKIIFCLKHNQKQKDLIVMNYNFLIGDGDKKSRFEDLFPGYFSFYFQSLNPDVQSRYAVYGDGKDDVKNIEVKDVEIKVILDEDSDVENRFSVRVIMTSGSPTADPKIKKFPKEITYRINYREDVDNFCRQLVSDILKENKNWLLNQ